jgi:hypothetical protein
MELTIGILLDTPDERKLIRSFLAASLSNPEQLRQLQAKATMSVTRATDEGIVRFSNWLLDSLAAADFLYSGEIRTSWFGGVSNEVRQTYSFRVSDQLHHLVSGTRGGERMWKGPLPRHVAGTMQPFAIFEGFDEKQRAAVMNLLTVDGAPDVDLMPADQLIGVIAESGSVLQAHPLSMNDPDAPAHHELARASRGASSQRGLIVGIRWILGTLLSQSLVLTRNQRVPYVGPIDYSADEVTGKILPSIWEQAVPLELYRLKTGRGLAKQKFLAIQGAFKALLGQGQELDIEMVHHVSPLRLDVRITDTSGEASLAMHGAGTWEAVMLSTLLLESEGRVIVLDEPAANLHPNVQRRLGSLVRASAGQVFIATQSPYLLPPQSGLVEQIVVLRKDGGHSRVHQSPETWAYEGRLDREVRNASGAAAFFFADGVIVVEGPSESAAIYEWFISSGVAGGKAPEELNLTIHPASGESAIPFYLEFMRAFAIPGAVICDGDALQTGSVLRRYLSPLLERAPETTFEAVSTIAADYGVFTYNRGFTGDFESVPEIAVFLGDGTHGRKPASALAAARAIACPPDVMSALRRALAYVQEGKVSGRHS